MNIADILIAIIQLQEKMAERLNNVDGSGNVPVKGQDYWTQQDIAQIKAYIDQKILNGEW